MRAHRSQAVSVKASDTSPSGLRLRVGRKFLLHATDAPLRSALGVAEGDPVPHSVREDGSRCRYMRRAPWTNCAPRGPMAWSPERGSAGYSGSGLAADGPFHRLRRASLGFYSRLEGYFCLGRNAAHVTGGNWPRQNRGARLRRRLTPPRRGRPRGPRDRWQCRRRSFAAG